VLGGNVTLGLGTGAFGSGGTLTVTLYNTSTLAGNLTGNGNVTVVGVAGSQLIFTGAVNVNGTFSVDPYVSVNLSTTSVYSVVPGAGNGIDLVSSQQIAALTGSDNSGNNAAFTGNGVLDDAAANPTLTIAATDDIPSTSNTFAGNFWNDVNVTLDSSINNVSQTLTLTGTENPTIGSFEVGNFQNPASTATSALVVDGYLGDNGTYGGAGTMTVGSGGILAGIGTVNPSTTVQPGGTVRGGDPNGSDYGTLTFNHNSNPANLQLLGDSTLQMGVNRTGDSPTGNTFSTSGGTGTAIGNASLLDVSQGNLILGSSATANQLGTSAGKYINIDLLDTAGSLVAGESYTFVLAEAPNGNIVVNQTTEGDGATIDSGAGLGLGSLGIANVAISNNSAYDRSVTGWSLTTNSSGTELLLNLTSVTALPVTVTSVQVNGSTAPILSATTSGGAVTITTDGPSGFSTGQKVLIAGVNGTGSASGFNGAFVITGTSGNTFTYADANAAGSSTDSGTATTDASAGVLTNGATNATSQRSMVDSIVYTFNQAVNLGANAVTITVLGQGGVVPTVSYASPDGGFTWVVTFSGSSVVGNSIANGEYQIVLNASAVSAVSGGGTLAGNDTESFYRLYGDTVGNGHQKVASADNNTFLGAFNTKSTQAAFLAYLDYDDNGKINSADTNAFLGDFNIVYRNFTAPI
jgi:hypothetical protein